jgi:hypothetical protein
MGGEVTWSTVGRRDGIIGLDYQKSSYLTIHFFVLFDVTVADDASR